MTPAPTGHRYARWPHKDRAAWDQAVAATTTGFLEERPRLAAWAPSTQKNARNVVSAFLSWLDARMPLPVEGSLADIMRPDVLLPYVRERLSTCTPPTAEYEVWLLHGALELFAPDRNWGWIKAVSRRLGTRARRHVPARRPVVHAKVLHDLGIEVIRESLNFESAVVDPSVYRSGLVVALLAAAPMRIANLAELEVGRQLRQDGRYWTIYLTADETKTRQADVWPISARLSLYIDQYLTEVRPALLGRARHAVNTARLWIGDSGQPIGQQALRPIIATLTRERLGTQINPHTFRHCAATTFALERPGNPLQSSALLGHASPQTTEEHYIIHQRQLVQQDYLRLLQKRRRSSRDG